MGKKTRTTKTKNHNKLIIDKKTLSNKLKLYDLMGVLYLTNNAIKKKKKHSSKGQTINTGYFKCPCEALDE